METMKWPSKRSEYFTKISEDCTELEHNEVGLLVFWFFS